jgi:putative transcriptional regulator
MPVTVHLDELLARRDMTLTELAGRVGITVANLSILKTSKARAIRFSTLDAICRELGCQPGDILAWEPAATDAAAATETPVAEPEAELLR